MKVRLNDVFSLLLFLSCKGPGETVTSDNINSFNYTIQKRIVCKQGAVVSAHPLASRAGVAAMKKGGNAFDASIATQLALAVVYPAAGNLGGGGFMVARLSNGQLISLDFRETAPGVAHRDMFLDSNGNVVQGKSIRSPSSAGVPGTVAGIMESLKYANLPLDHLIEPAIHLAENGFAISKNEASALNELQDDLNQYNNAATAFHRSISWKEGDTLVQKELAGSLKRIRDDGLNGFYQGETARLIAEEMQSGAGYITEDDLRNYKPKWREPHSFQYRDYKIVSMGLPSSGGILINQMMKMIENKPLGNYGHLSPAAVQLMTEAERRAFADRAVYLGDADFYKVPVTQLTGEKYLLNRMNDYTEGKAGNSRDIQAGIVLNKESMETTHISIMDNEGNAVAVTTTLNDSYGSKTVVKGAGFFLNNEMDDFSVKAGEPNMYGAIGGEANAIAPGKRMLSSMTPTIVLKNDQPFLIAGTPGGTTIPTSIFQTIINILDFGLSASDAVNLPKFHHQWLPDSILIEHKFPGETKIALEKMGYKLWETASIGRTEVIKVLPDGQFEAVADRRGEDSAEGY